MLVRQAHPTSYFRFAIRFFLMIPLLAGERLNLYTDYNAQGYLEAHKALIDLGIQGFETVLLIGLALLRLTEGDFMIF